MIQDTWRQWQRQMEGRERLYKYSRSESVPPLRPPRTFIKSIPVILHNDPLHLNCACLCHITVALMSVTVMVIKCFACISLLAPTGAKSDVPGNIPSRVTCVDTRLHAFPSAQLSSRNPPSQSRTNKLFPPPLCPTLTSPPPRHPISN